jgi:hypothetical protein
MPTWRSTCATVAAETADADAAGTPGESVHPRFLTQMHDAGPAPRDVMNPLDCHHSRAAFRGHGTRPSQPQHSRWPRVGKKYVAQEQGHPRCDELRAAATNRTLMRRIKTVFLRLLPNLASSRSLRRKQRPSQRRDRVRHIATCCDES